MFIPLRHYGGLFLITMASAALVPLITLSTIPSAKPIINKSAHAAPQISGWIAWWAEDSAYQLIASHSAQLTSVSPVWFQIHKNLTLSDIGQADRQKTVAALSAKNIKIYPSVGSELSGKELGTLLHNASASSRLVASLSAQLVSLGVNGVDIDLEGISSADQDVFIKFLSDLADKLRANHLYLSVSVGARLPTTSEQGNADDISRIAGLADEVRIMTYDQHSTASDAGPIAALDWIGEVAVYNSLLAPKSKIVMGLPSYGYVWETDGTKKGLQFDEFSKYVSTKQTSTYRDQLSGESVFKNADFNGWLSDAQAMTKKIQLLRNLGFNKFVIWHLGGMDEQFFATDWTKI